MRLETLRVGNLVSYNSIDAIVYGMSGGYPSPDPKWSEVPTVDFVMSA